MERNQVAVDYSRFERRQKAVEPEVPVELVEKPEQRRVKIKTRLPYKTLATLAAAAVMLVLVIVSYNKVWSQNAANADLDKQYQQLKQEEQILLQDSGSTLSMQQIEQIAREAGMAAPAQDQVVYIHNNGTDQAEVHRDSSLWAKLTGWIGDLFK